MNYVAGVKPGQVADADMVNLVAASVNDQPRKATKMINTGDLDWELIAANAIACLAWMVKVLPKLGDMMTEGVQKDIDRQKIAA